MKARLKVVILNFLETCRVARGVQLYQVQWKSFNHIRVGEPFYYEGKIIKNRHNMYLLWKLCTDSSGVGRGLLDVLSSWADPMTWSFVEACCCTRKLENAGAEFLEHVFGTPGCSTIRCLSTGTCGSGTGGNGWRIAEGWHTVELFELSSKFRPENLSGKQDEIEGSRSNLDSLVILYPYFKVLDADNGVPWQLYTFSQVPAEWQARTDINMKRMQARMWLKLYSFSQDKSMQEPAEKRPSLGQENVSSRCVAF